MIQGKIIIDAANSPLGRLASFSAKQALLGKEIIILNCEAAVISGMKPSIISKYKQARTRGGSARKGPNFPKIPERLVKRTIRGMLSYKEGRGRDAMKKIMCYNNTPKEYENAEKISLQKIFNVKTMALKELSEKI